MRLQDSQANCGPAGLSNALAALGVARSGAECEALCGTTATEGTPLRAMLKALKALTEVNAVRIQERRGDVALLRLLAFLDVGRPVMLVVDQGAHWVAAVGRLGSRVLVADSADSELVLSYTPQELAVRWYDGRTYYGVAL